MYGTTASPAHGSIDRWIDDHNARQHQQECKTEHTKGESSGRRHVCAGGATKHDDVNMDLYEQ
jgi:hypothetical protein